MKKNYTIIKLLLLLFLISSHNVMAQIIANGTYKIYSSVHSETMKSAAASPYDVSMTTPNPTDNYQLWTFTHQGSDIYKITNLGSGLSLGIKDGWCGVFGDVQAGFQDTAANVEFKISNSATTNKYVIQIAFTTCNFGSSNTPVKAFDIQDGAVGAQIQTYDVDTSNPNQQFEIIPSGSLSTNSFEAKIFSVSPNPTTSLWKIATSATNIKSIKLYNSMGKEMQTINTNQSETTIDATPFTSGIYFAKITTDNTTQTIRVVKN
jgi:Secretion system C-terminal sorting domain